MKKYQYIHISLMLITSCIITPKIIKDRQQKRAIIFDLTNVVIQENQNEFAKKIGYGVLASYAITHWKNPGHRCLDMLAAISNHETQKPHITITLKKRILPRFLIELQEGKKTCAQVKAEIKECIEVLDSQKFFSSCKEKNLMTNIMNLILDPTIIATIIEPIKSTILLIQKLKTAGYPVYLVANAPEELYTAVQNKYPDIIKLFNGVVISSHIKTVKPEAAIFNHLLNTYNLNANNCILIDDLEESALAAKSLGMEAIVFDKTSHVIKQLKKYGINL